METKTTGIGDNCTHKFLALVLLTGYGYRKFPAEAHNFDEGIPILRLWIVCIEEMV